MACIDNIRQTITKKFQGKAFTVQDFLTLGEYDAIRQALSRLNREGSIRRVLHGVYDKPYYSDLLKEFTAPSPQEVAFALARKHGWSISVSGDAALNMLGLSTQVPATWSFVSTGPYKKYRLERITLEFLHRADSQLASKSLKTAMIIQALKALGPDNCGPDALARIRKVISSREKAQLARESASAPIWMKPIIKKISEA